MIIGLLKEPDFETRVSLLAESVAALVKKGITVWVESGAGDRSFCTDEDYRNAGAEITNREKISSEAEILLAIHPLNNAELKNNGQIQIGVYQPLFNTEYVKSLENAGITAFSLDRLPRTTRAQAMDVLSSQANIAGYKAVLEAANLYPHYFPMFMTAAGSIAPAKVLILGAGVAGLQAIATARRLGAVVEVFDTRPAVKEEVMSLGAKFVEVDGAADASQAGGYAVDQTEDYKKRQQEKIAEKVAKSDIVITTAQLQGKKAPILISEEMISSMRNGSVIIDLASSTGGNTALTKDNETITQHGVTIVGNSFLSSTMPSDASKLYGKNVINFLQLIIDKEGKLNLNWEDELVKGCCISHKEMVSESNTK